MTKGWPTGQGLKEERLEDHMDFYETKEEFEEERKRIPIQDPYINFFETYRSVDAKRFIAVLMKIYPELYIDVDESDFWSGTAQEYLDTEFDY